MIYIAADALRREDFLEYLVADIRLGRENTVNGLLLYAFGWARLDVRGGTIPSNRPPFRRRDETV